MDVSKLQDLKSQLQNEMVLANVWRYFLDHFGENPEFIDIGEPGKNEFIDQVLAQVTAQLFPDEDSLIQLRLVHVPEGSFYHGACTINGRVGGVLYFEDIQLGLVVVTHRPPSINVEYARFSGRNRPPSTKPSVN